ncbi:hypothetical protein EPUL_004106 [Erysiphe pulchra]|uniref:Uncharacterized protein n=1 Tax=Erysiphe pulchra TaxID=225359 RepID=A0A2S4PPY1_9PEZI|nr:hypothetical protein EPUL_004106 [Erysiphe pulchra]
MFSSMIRRAAKNSVTPVHNKIYRSKTIWPPDFSKLDAKQQFRYERKFKRRSKLKWLRPRWVKGVKIAQFTSIVFVLVYGVLFMDLSTEGSPRHRPFAGVRNWFFGMTEDLFGYKNTQRNHDPDRHAVSPTAIEDK